MTLHTMTEVMKYNIILEPGYDGLAIRNVDYIKLCRVGTNSELPNELIIWNSTSRDLDF